MPKKKEVKRIMLDAPNAQAIKLKERISKLEDDVKQVKAAR
jgi:hypothetical protein